MNPRCLSVAAAVALLAGLVGCESSTNENEVPQAPSLATRKSAPVTERYLVVFKQGVAPTTFAQQVRELGGTVVVHSNRLNFASVAGLSSTALAKLARNPRIEAVSKEPMLNVIPDQRIRRRKAVRTASASDPASAFFFASLQWDLKAIHADDAWAAGRLGASNVRVGILDTGLDYTNPDLAGLVDLNLSIDLVDEADSITKYIGAGRHPITDLNGHGSQVGGTVSSNALIVAGVTSQTTLVGVKVCTMRGSCPFGGVLEGIAYAADVGASVINLSLGGLAPRSALRGFESLLNRAVNYARRKGALVVVAAGNDGVDLDHGSIFAALCDVANVVCVSATGPTGQGAFGPFVNVDAFAPYSNFGRSAINLAAPGGNLVFDQQGNIVDVTPVWGVCSLTSLAFANFPPAPDEPPIGLFCPSLSIAGFVGTSQATPHVTGVAALVKAAVGGNPAQLRSRVLQTSDDLGQPGTDPFYGKGRVNAARAVGVE